MDTGQCVILILFSSPWSVYGICIGCNCTYISIWAIGWCMFCKYKATWWLCNSIVGNYYYYGNLKYRNLILGNLFPYFCYCWNRQGSMDIFLLLGRGRWMENIQRNYHDPVIGLLAWILHSTWSGQTRKLVGPQVVLQVAWSDILESRIRLYSQLIKVHIPIVPLVIPNIWDVLESSTEDNSVYVSDYVINVYSTFWWNCYIDTLVVYVFYL